MRKKLGTRLFLVALAVFWSGVALSIEPPPAQNPNGFISGSHYNLNIIGKKEGFTCPVPVPGEYGNVIYVPENGNNININMQSGKASRFATVPELQVTDACVFEPDATAGNDYAAMVQLPKSAKGYWVFARTLAKPGIDRSMSIHPSLNMVQDDLGNELWYLGSLGPDGTVCVENNLGLITCSLTRVKGKSTAMNITGIFDWSGSVCYFTEPASYTETKQLCCSQADTDGDGLPEYLGCYPAADQTLPACLPGEVLATTYCSTYANEWVFNIGDFVEYLWNIDNQGIKLVQVRFYPIP